MLSQLVRFCYEKFAAPVRNNFLARQFASYFEGNEKVLDLGASEGKLAFELKRKLPSLDIIGADVVVQPKTYIPVTKYDGATLPFGDNFFDVVMLVDVVHHDDARKVLKEAKRVSRKYILVKDFYWKNKFEFFLLKFTDYLWNEPFGIKCKNKYLKISEWEDIFKELKLSIVKSEEFKITPLDPPHILLALEKQ